MFTDLIAGQLGTAENTIEVHRGRAMEKMHAQSLADLVRMVEKLKTPHTKGRINQSIIRVLLSGALEMPTPNGFLNR